jgi:hypothetical protein
MTLSLSYGKQRRLFSKHNFYRLPHGEPYPGDLTVDPHAAASPPAATGCDSWYSEPSNPSIFFLTQPYPKSDPRHGVGPAARHEADGVVRLGGARRARRAAVYTGGGTPSFDDDYLSVEPVFDTDADDLHDGPVFGTYLANLDDAPVFDADPADLADGPVFDVDPADLADGPVFDADPGDLDDGPVFDTEPLPDRVAAPMCELAKSEFNAFDQGLDDLSSARVNASLDEGLLLAEKHTQVEAASSFGTWVIFSSNEAVPATTVATPSVRRNACIALSTLRRRSSSSRCRSSRGSRMIELWSQSAGFWMTLSCSFMASVLHSSSSIGQYSLIRLNLRGVHPSIGTLH